MLNLFATLWNLSDPLWRYYHHNIFPPVSKLSRYTISKHNWYIESILAYPFLSVILWPQQSAVLGLDPAFSWSSWEIHASWISTLQNKPEAQTFSEPLDTWTAFTYSHMCYQQKWFLVSMVSGGSQGNTHYSSLHMYYVHTGIAVSKN